MVQDPRSARTERAALVRQRASREGESRGPEPAAGGRRQLLAATQGAAERFLGTLATRPAFDARPDPGLGLLDLPIQEEGRPLAEVIAALEREVVDPGSQPAHPAHFAYIPGGGLYHAALGDYLAAVTDKYSGIFFTGPGPVRMENLVVRWAADLVGYPAAAAGHTASGGSIATLTALASPPRAPPTTSRGATTSARWSTSPARPITAWTRRSAWRGSVRCSGARCRSTTAGACGPTRSPPRWPPTARRGSAPG